jgi:phosphoglycolate phosphatase-like HAD superfamily hydrolase
MPPWKNVIAMIFDFDDTLTPDSVSMLLRENSICPNDFWTEVNFLVGQGWERTNAWIHLLLQKLPNLKSQHLRQFGKSLTPYPGLPELFADLKDIAAKALCEVEFYIVSECIEDIITGFEEGFHSFGRFTAVWGSRVGSETPDGPLKYVKRTITFTEKTRYLFLINKGISAEEAHKDPHLVNEVKKDRRIPFENMFYIGDGLSDIPCFSLLKQRAPNGRQTFGVFRAGEQESTDDFVKLGKLMSRTSGGAHNADYGNEQPLGLVLRTAIAKRCSAIWDELPK